MVKEFKNVKRNFTKIENHLPKDKTRKINVFNLLFGGSSGILLGFTIKKHKCITFCQTDRLTGKLIFSLIKYTFVLKNKFEFFCHKIQNFRCNDDFL